MYYCSSTIDRLEFSRSSARNSHRMTRYPGRIQGLVRAISNAQGLAMLTCCRPDRGESLTIMFPCGDVVVLIG